MRPGKYRRLRTCSRFPIPGLLDLCPPYIRESERSALEGNTFMRERENVLLSRVLLAAYLCDLLATWTCLELSQVRRLFDVLPKAENPSGALRVPVVRWHPSGFGSAGGRFRLRPNVRDRSGHVRDRRVGKEPLLQNICAMISILQQWQNTRVERSQVSLLRCVVRSGVPTCIGQQGR